MNPTEFIHPIKAFDDNYIWLLKNGQQALVVDPGLAQPVLDFLEQNKLELTAILNTHHHADHVGGIEELLTHYPKAQVWGPESQSLTTIHCKSGDTVEPLPGFEFRCIEIPGHTLDHIAFFNNHEEQPFVFCGDTLFAGGCGRMFEGTAEQMHSSLEKLASLPGNTLVYCAHEYTLANLEFAAVVEPNNPELEQRIAQAIQKRAELIPTVPSELTLELATNPFMRCRQSSIQKAASQRSKAVVSNPSDTFAIIRKWKDTF